MGVARRRCGPAVGGRARQRRVRSNPAPSSPPTPPSRSCNARSPCCAPPQPTAGTHELMDVDALRGRANELGVEWSYWDNEGRYHESDMRGGAARRRGARGRRRDRAAQPGTGDRGLAGERPGRRGGRPGAAGARRRHRARAGGVRRAVSFCRRAPDRQPSAVAHRARPRRVDHHRRRAGPHAAVGPRSPGAPACSPRPTRCGSTTPRCPPSSSCAASARRCPGWGSTCS